MSLTRNLVERVFELQFDDLAQEDLSATRLLAARPSSASQPSARPPISARLHPEVRARLGSCDR